MYVNIKLNIPANYYKINLNRWSVVRKRLYRGILFGAPCIKKLSRTVNFTASALNLIWKRRVPLALLWPWPYGRALSDDARLSVWRLSVAYIGPKSRTERPRKTKIGTEVAHVTRDSNTTFKVKKSKVNLQGRGHIVAASHTACYCSLRIVCQISFCSNKCR